MSVSLLALAASTRPDSLNKRLLAHAIAHANAAGAMVTLFDYADCMVPLYLDEEGAALPAGIEKLSAALRLHDGLILASPEYNWSIPGALKNVIDWLSIDSAAPLKTRHALLMCASPSVRGGILGLHQLSVPLNHLGMHVYPHLIAIGDAANQLGSIDHAVSKDGLFLKECVTDFVHSVRPAVRG